MDETPASGSSDSNDSDIREFLEILEGQFKGRRCYLGQYAKAKEASKANEDGQDSNNGGSSSPGVGSVVVTLEARNKLVLGVFLRTGAIDNAWEYWEGNFGPSELVAHRNSLGWDGHSLEALGDCFVGAVDGATQPPQRQPSTVSDAMDAEEHEQRPPEFSKAAEERSDGEDNAVQPGAGEPSAADTGTLDLHYAGAGIVGSWEIRRVQTGVSTTLVNSMHRNIRAARWRKSESTGPVETTSSASGSGKLSSTRAKSSGAHKAKRPRFTGKGATLIGAHSSAQA